MNEEKKERKPRQKRTGVVKMIEITKDGKPSISEFDSKLAAKEYCADQCKGNTRQDGITKTKDGGVLIMFSGKFLHYAEVVKKTNELI